MQPTFCGLLNVGTPYGMFAVIEVQGRGSMHLHLLYWGSFTPDVLQTACTAEYLHDIRVELQNMFRAHVPREDHIAYMTMRCSKAVRNTNLPREKLQNEIV